LKERITNNLGIKVLSLFLAVIFWAMVINIDDPVTSRQFTNVPVKIINENAVSTLDKVYEVIQGETVDITVTGRKSLVDNVTTNDLQATADLSQLSLVNSVNIYTECTKYPSLNCSLGKVQTLRVSLENMKTVQFVPVIQQVGTVADGYYAVDATSKPNIIKVIGAKTQVQKVAEVRLEVDVSNAKKDFTTVAEPKVYDANGEELDKDKYKFSVTQARVEVDVRKTKTIPVTLDVTGDVNYGYECTSIEYEPKKIVIAGRQKQLDQIDELVIPIDLTGWNKGGETSADVASFLPEKVTVSSANPTISIQLEIEQWTSMNIPFTGSDVTISGKNENYKYKNLSSHNAYSVTVLGIQEMLDKMNIKKCNPHINVEGLEKGTHLVDIIFDEPESGKINTTGLKVRIKISERESSEADCEFPL
jgi:YbbR domain-containing protein